MSENLRIGDDALLSNEGGSENTAVGNEALMNVEGSENTAIGNRAGKFNANGTPCLTAEKSTFVGDDSRASADGAENEVVIGNGAVGAGSNIVVLGNASIVETQLKGLVKLPSVMLPKANAEPVNAVAAKAVLVVADRPDDFIKMVKSSKEVTVANQPNTLVKATGTITVTGTPVADETFVVGADTYTFKAAPSANFELGIDADNGVQAGLIAAAIEEFSEAVDAVATLGDVALTAKTGGVAGNSLDLTENATGLAVSGSGHFEGGVDADTLILDEGEAGAITYTFVENGHNNPAESEIELGTDVAGTAAAIAAKTMPATLICAFVSPAKVKFTAVANGTAGDGIAINSDGTRITGDGDTAGGVDEVKSYLTVNGIDYVFANSAGDDPEVTYPACHKVATAGGSTTAQIATALKAALILDTTAFTTASISVLNNVLTVKYKVKGSAGNLITYVNHLLTAGHITDDLTDGTLKDAIDGTPAYKGMATTYGLYLYLCTVDDYTTGQDGWVRTLFATY